MTTDINRSTDIANAAAIQVDGKIGCAEAVLPAPAKVTIVLVLRRGRVNALARCHE